MKQAPRGKAGAPRLFGRINGRRRVSGVRASHHEKAGRKSLKRNSSAGEKDREKVNLEKRKTRYRGFKLAHH